MITKPKAARSIVATQSTKLTRPSAIKRPASTQSTPSTQSTESLEIPAHYLNLCELYNAASVAYYKDSKPTMSDSEFDELTQKIKTMRSSYPSFLSHLPDPTAHVVSDHVDGFKKVAHSYPMLSLQDIYTEDELNKFVKSVSLEEMEGLSVECKLDGLSLSLIYEEGKLIRAVTRGNGTEGDDVTAQARCIPSIPQDLDHDIDCEVRGEVVMPFDAFNRYNETHPNDKFANPRNAASGTLKSHDPKKCRERGLLFVAYYISTKCISYATQWASVNVLTQHSFLTPRNYDGMHICQAHELMDTILKVKSANYSFPIDGVVVKFNRRNRWEELGYTDKFYKWGTAFKFKQESLRSRLLQVNWQVADSGRVTPVAIYEPIEMYGTICQRATLNNVGWIKENLGELRIGDTLLLTKGGEIIPKITGVVHREAVPMDVVCPQQWSETCGDDKLICQIGGIVAPPKFVGGKPTRMEGAYLMVDVEPKAKPATPAPPPPAVKSATLKGKTVLVSGNFGTPQIRKDIERAVVENGGKLANGVTLSVDYYVLPDNLEEWKRKAGSKWIKIQSYMHQSRIINKDKFYSLLS